MARPHPRPFGAGPRRRGACEAMVTHKQHRSTCARTQEGRRGSGEREAICRPSGRALICASCHSPATGPSAQASHMWRLSGGFWPRAGSMQPLGAPGKRPHAGAAPQGLRLHPEWEGGARLGGRRPSWAPGPCWPHSWPLLAHPSQQQEAGRPRCWGSGSARLGGVSAEGRLRRRQEARHLKRKPFSK